MTGRLKFFRFGISIMGLIILSRLFYWQVIKSGSLALEAQTQRTRSETLDASRGSILASDGYVLTANREFYQLFAYKPQLKVTYSEISKSLAPIIIDEPKDATQAAIPLPERISLLEQDLLSKLNHPDRSWIPLKRGITKQQKEEIEAMGYVGLGFDVYERRYYPEASMSAHVLGFVGHDDTGNPKGYFGIEGEYDLELQGKPGKLIQEKDPNGNPILIGLFNRFQSRQGRNLELYLDRTVQHTVENRLLEALELYGAKSGEVILMDPKTGGIIASASFPNYDPANVGEYDPSHYKNPIIANSYEPGSTFKVLVMAAGIEEGVIEPETICGSACSAPTQIGKYSIKTWNNEYDPTQSMTQVLANSDNTGMIFVARKLGQDKFVDYINKFGFGKLTQVDLQEESSPYLRQKWGEIDLATSSFGQGIAVSGMQMVTAVSAIANGGKLMEPHVVSKVYDEDRIIPINPKVVDQVISPETAAKVTQMMVEAAHHGEAKWAVLRDYEVAGKTGTAQIPIEGHYDSEKTIASFVGFVPAKDPKFVMLVKLREPESSPWAAETAAPLWYRIAKDVLLYYNIPPDTISPE